MADTLYAWTTFRLTDADAPNDRSKMKVIKPGDKVSSGDFGLEDDSDDWKAYLDNGAVRPMEYPDLKDFPGSPVEYAKSQLAALAAEGGYFDTQYGRVYADTSVAVGPDGEPLPPEEAQVPAPQVEAASTDKPTEVTTTPKSTS